MGRVASHPPPSPKAVPPSEFQAAPLPILDSSRHDLSTFPSHELRGRPFSLLHSWLSLTERTLWAGLTWPYRRGWRSRTILLTGLERASGSSRWSDTKSFQWYPMILWRHLVPKSSRRLFKSLFSIYREAVAEWIRRRAWGRTDVDAWVRTPPVLLWNFVSFTEWLKNTYMSP